MRQQNSMSLGRQIRVVLHSYMTRPGFRWTLAAMVLGPLGHFAAAALRPRGYLSSGHYSPALDTAAGLLAFLGVIAFYAGLVGSLWILNLHGRQQLMGSSARLLPRTRKANLVVGGALLVVMAAAIARLSIIENFDVYLGVFIIVWGALILLAYAFCRPWLLIFIALGIGLMVRHPVTSAVLTQLTHDFDREMREMYLYQPRPSTPAWEAFPWRVSIAAEHKRYVRMLRSTALLVDVLAFIGLAWAARPIAPRLAFASFLRQLAPKPKPVEAMSPVRGRQFIDSRLSRSLHRRFAVHDWRAAGVTGVAVAALTAWLCLQFGGGAIASRVSMLLVFLPGALVAIGWRERWPILDFESLYPVSRQQFVTDMAVGLALDVAEFWAAALAGTLLALICVRSSALHEARFWGALLAGGLMQFLWLGAIYSVGQGRQTFWYIAGLTPFVFAMFLPIDALWSGEQPIAATTAIAIAFLEMLVGFTLLAGAMTFGRRAVGA